MQIARVYKVKLRENVLRQMIFTDKTIVIGIIALIGAGIWYWGRNLSSQIKVFTTLIFSGVVILGLTSKIDNQPSYKILARAIPFIFRRKEIRF